MSRKPVTSTNITRCWINTFLLMAFLALAFSSTAQAQSHGVTVAKDCTDQNVTTCWDDESCAADQCIIGTCTREDTSATCTVTLTNADTWLDTLRVDSAIDIVHAPGGDVVLPLGGGDLPILEVGEFASCEVCDTSTGTCSAGEPVLPCVLDPPGDTAAGYVVFLADYELQESDEVLEEGERLSNQGTVGITDLCDGPQSSDPNTNGCDDTPDLPQNKTASTPTKTGCTYTPKVCPPDNNPCTEDFLCDTTPALCPPPGPPKVCDPDDNACTEDFECDTATGLCPPPGPPLVCDDEVCQQCDTSTGICVDKPELPPECLAINICRTPGFWATHAGTEKGPSQNITQQVIDASVVTVCDSSGGNCVEETGYISVCGVQIDNTSDLDEISGDPLWNSTANREKSSTEAMCVAVKGDSNRQLVRQLTAFALNCVMSGGDGDCAGMEIYLSDLAEECNAVCVDGESGGRSVNDCIDEIDAFNNGLMYGPDGPYSGMCSEDQAYCSEDSDCNQSITQQTCVVDEDNCHDRELCQPEGLCFLKPGPAGSSGACKMAKKNDIYVAD